ncbi:TraR/DksA family transcriptional regulator [Serinicoccus marinus]|uniref:TraR/DksA family transcriptional regulator n=1 Tax=Serinicoccus marinus TaxID=247333 RepID=UPI0003B46415|nr:TraR/DksA C4-type zinc finger protein [Serinicoccus marinus]
MATTAKKGGSGTATRPGRGKGEHRALSVREGESPWSAAEVEELREELEGEIARLRAEVEEAEQELFERGRAYGDGAGDDQADAGSATWEREHELSVTNNARDLIDQNTHALDRIADGSYGDCESCGTPIGKMRLQAFPRATLCMSCKQKQERR